MLLTHLTWAGNFADALQQAVESRGIRVNAMSPGPILTPLVEANPEQTAPILAKVPMKRMGRPEGIAKTVAFLLSEGASFISGAKIVADCGRTLL